MALHTLLLPSMKIAHPPITSSGTFLTPALCGLLILTFDLLISKLVGEILVTQVTFSSIMGWWHSLPYEGKGDNLYQG